MRVSIIMPSYNADRFIADSIRSVQAQTYGDWELIVSDDGSTDGTRDIVEAAAREDSRIRYIAGTVNRGPAHSRNVAIAAASSRYIAFLDSDDLWKPEKLQRQIGFMRERDVAFSFSSYDRIDARGRLIDTHYVREPVDYRQLLHSNVIGCLTAVYDRAKIGTFYCPDIRKRQDFGLWLNILKCVDAAHPIPDSLAQYRVHDGSVSADKLSAARYTWLIYRDVEKLGLVRSAYLFSHYTANGLYTSFIRPRLARRSARRPEPDAGRTHASRPPASGPDQPIQAGAAGAGQRAAAPYRRAAANSSEPV